ncbi:hypothetical protein [Leptolyngbya sp. Cla-17]|uniref:hypothetical protein n=1 Tax=Leptolyngbya sp. Cla-17 TaxID=2803751 RepID=UPI001A90D4F5|nr:hypothetical protein [Leptolyngbya sp. Cla-17]
MLIGISVAASFWFSPSGTGEYQTSPDGKFTAHASNMSRGTFIGRLQYIELRVVESVTQREVWRVEFRHEVVTVPDYGDRSKQSFVDWAQDSSSVTISVGGKRQVTIPMQ